MKKLLILPLLFSCTKNVTENKFYPPTEQKVEASLQDQDIQEFERLFKSERPNIAFAQFIARSLKDKSSSSLGDLSEMLTEEEIQRIIQTTRNENKAIRKYYLYHNNEYQNDHILRSDRLDMSEVSDFSFHDHLVYNTFQYLQHRTLENISNTYQAQITKLESELIPTIAKKILTEAPQDAQEIEQLVSAGKTKEAIDKIQDSILKLESISRILGDSNLSSGDKIVLASGGALAFGIYQQLKDHKDFIQFTKNVREVIRTVDELKSKYKEFTALAGSLGSGLDQIKTGMGSFTSELTHARDGLRDMFRMASESAPGTSGVQSQRIVDFVKDQIKGKKSVKPDEFSDQYRQRAIQITTSLNKSFEAAHSATQGLNSIINASVRMTQILGVRLPPDLNKAIDKAQKVIAVVSLGKNIMDAYASGGVVPALNLLSGQSPFSNPQSEQLSQINQKLDEVLANQKIMIEAQLATMSMIKDLSIMIDRYHEKEMNALAELRDFSLIQLEILKSNNLNSNIQVCEQIINFHLSSAWSVFHEYKSPYQSINQLQILDQKIYSKINSLGDLRRMLLVGGPRVLEDCHQAFAKSFGTSFNNENPLLAIFDSNEDNNLMRFKRNVYLPTLQALKMQTNGTTPNQAPLHLPSKTFKYSYRKLSYFGSNQEGVNRYNLSLLISSKNLERYVTSLLLLYPVFEVRESLWEKDIKEIVDNYFERSNERNQFSNKSTLFLQNALSLTQSAIAQEAIMAGEPTLPGFDENLSISLLSKSDCGNIANYYENSEGADFICALRSNPLFMRNHLVHSLNRNLLVDRKFHEHYQRLLETKNFKALQQILKTDAEIVELTKNNKSVLALKLSGLRASGSNDVFIKLPTPQDVLEGKVLYSENMQKLLVIQDSIISHLEKTFPIQREFNQKFWTQILIQK